MKTIARQQTIDLMAAVAMWLEAVVFMDSGASKGEVDEPDYSVAATLINSLAMSYGWTVAEIMSQPMALVMQLGKARADYHGNKRTHWNYHQDAARRRFLDGMTGS